MTTKTKLALTVLFVLYGFLFGTIANDLAREYTHNEPPHHGENSIHTGMLSYINDLMILINKNYSKLFMTQATLKEPSSH